MVVEFYQNLAKAASILFVMDGYDNLDDDEKNEKYPDEFVEELQEEFQSGNIVEAIERAEDQGIEIEEIIS